MDWFRGIFCFNETQDTLCAVPVGGGEKYDNEEQWCLQEQNTTGCRGVRDEAQVRCSVVYFA